MAVSNRFSIAYCFLIYNQWYHIWAYEPIVWLFFSSASRSDLTRPPVRSNGRTYKMLWCFLLFSPQIFELTRPIAAKLCHMIGTGVNFINWLQKFGGLSPLKNGGQKHAKFRSILYNLRLWSRKSPERLKISKIRKLIHRRQFLLRYMKSPVNFGPLITETKMWVRTH